MHKENITLKLLLIGAIAALCLIASFVVQGVTFERESRHNEVQDEIGATWGTDQTVLGPILVANSNDRTSFVLPNSLEIESELTPELRRRGIYETVIYYEKLHLHGSFRHTDISTLPSNVPVKLVIVLTDTRSIEEIAILTWNENEVTLNPGTTVDALGNTGVHTLLPATLLRDNPTFSLDITLKGSENVAFVPVGEETVVNVASPWQLPSFDGAYLPATHAITDDGFNATWKVSAFGRSYPQTWTVENSKVHQTYSEFMNSSFGVTLNTGIDMYTLISRSIRYAVLFILITFTAFFLFETLRSLRVHPVQYFLVGASLALFYLLLLSMTEHIGFAYAYLISSILVVILITTYSISVLKQKKRAFSIFTLLSVLYAYLYFVLNLEDYALLFGTLLVFTLLGTVMYLTRNVDWYNENKCEN